MAEPVEMLVGVLTQVCPRNHTLGETLGALTPEDGAVFWRGTYPGPLRSIGNIWHEPELFTRWQQQCDRLVSVLQQLVSVVIGDVVLLCILSQLSVRGKNSKEKLSGFFRTVTQSVDEVLLSNQKDKDEFFDHQRTFLVEYFTRVKDATMKSDKMTKSHKSKSTTWKVVVM